MSLTSHILKKSLPICIPEAWKRCPFRTEPGQLSHYRDYPPPPFPPPPLKELLEENRYPYITTRTIISLFLVCVISRWLNYPGGRGRNVYWLVLSQIQQGSKVLTIKLNDLYIALCIYKKNSPIFVAILDKCQTCSKWCIHQLKYYGRSRAK